MSGAPYRLPPRPGEVLDRTRTLGFTWEGREYTAHPGDTIGSALAAWGVQALARGLKYRRLRGMLAASIGDPGGLVQVDGEPNVPAGHRRVSHGADVRAQGVWPSLRFDVMTANRLVSRLLGPGFYYKTFMAPARLWPAYDRVLRRFSPGGRVGAPPEVVYAHRFVHADVVVAGGGPAGIAAAAAAAREGARVLLADDGHELGGHLRHGGAGEREALSRLLDELAASGRVEVLSDAVVFGRYDGGLAGIERRVEGGQTVEELVKVRPRALVLAPGLVERPYVFAGNDLPGVMLSTGVRRLVNLYAVRPGATAVVLTANPEGDAAVEDLRDAGVEVAHVEDARAGGGVLRARGGRRVRAVQLADRRWVECDLLVTATGWTAPTALANMAGDRPRFDTSGARFVPDSARLPDDVLVTGGLLGDGCLEELVAHAGEVGAEAARRAAGSAAAPVVTQLSPRAHPWLFRAATHGVIDFSEDVTSRDVTTAAAEGYDSVELAKRYTTATMGPSQGRFSTVNLVASLAEATGQLIGDVGTTTWRPPCQPVTLGALASGAHHPVRRSVMQEWHERNGARSLLAGPWIRPDHYGDPQAEVRCVRERVGLIDVSPIGKLDLRGPEVPELLELLYVNRWRQLEVGRVRYGVMCDEQGVVFDDGVVGRLAEDHWLMTTTSSGVERVTEWIEWWTQVERPELDVALTPATDVYASMNLAGPAARAVLARVCDDVDLSDDGFGYMRVRTGTVAGVEGCVLWRIGFTGGMSFEVHAPAFHGLHVWQSLLEAGRPWGIAAVGIEAQRVLRLEQGHLIVGQDTDALTGVRTAGLDGLVKLDKPDFAGRPEVIAQFTRDDHPRLVALDLSASAPVPDEGCQIVIDGRLMGRVTSSRWSPTLERPICLAQVDAGLSEPGCRVTVVLPDRRRVAGTVARTLRRVEVHAPEVGADPSGGFHPGAASGDDAPAWAAPAGPDGQRDAPVSVDGVEISDVSSRRTRVVHAPDAGEVAARLGEAYGVCSRHGNVTVVHLTPGQWEVVEHSPDPDAGHTVRAGRDEAMNDLASALDDAPAVVDITPGQARLRLDGPRVVGTLATVCALDLGIASFPVGRAVRTLVAGVATQVLREPHDPTALVLCCDRSLGRHLRGVIIDAARTSRVVSTARR